MTEPAHKHSLLHSLADKLGFGKPKYHIFVCVGPDCCTNEVGAHAFQYLQRRLRELGLDKGEHHVKAQRTGCMKVCGNGPIAVVYPGEVWYENLTPDRIDWLIREHFAKDQIVAPMRFTPPPEARAPRANRIDGKADA